MRLSQRHPFTALGLLAVLIPVASIFTAGCTAKISGQAAPAVTLEKPGPAGAVPAGLDHFYGQTLAWGDCTDYATTAIDRYLYGTTPDISCARLTVPLDYANPQGKIITLGLLRHKATDSSLRIGSLITNPGGPGASGMEAAAAMVPQLVKTELGKRFDLVGFDPRGVGASTPAVRCLTDAELDAQRAANDTPKPGAAKQDTELHDYVNKCVQNTGADMLANVGTRDVAKDLDVLRSALGDPKLSYLGYSYGTFIGSTYAEDFPANVRALVLDGAIDPTQTPTDAEVAQLTGFEKAFHDFAAWCATQQGCPLGADQQQADHKYQGLVLPLINKPISLADGRKLSYSDATTATVQALYNKQLWAPLLEGLIELESGSGDSLMSLADNYDGRGLDGKYSNEQDAFNAIKCVDSSRITDQNVLLDEAKRIKQAAPFLDDGQPLPAKAPTDQCTYWPVPPTSQPHLPKVTGLPPTLVVSTTNDPATPYQAGVNLAAALHGFLLTYQGTQHTAFLQDPAVSCVDNVGIGYLVDLKLPATDPKCS